MDKKRFVILGMFFLTVVLIGINFISSQNQITYCAERTENGAWCQDVPEDQVDKDYRYVPTACESTSYCKPGVCVNTGEGLCMENTPEVVCTDEGGVWRDSDVSEIPQCQLGCCILGDEAAFVTQTRCKKISADSNLETNYRTDINSESACIAIATGGAEGACVIETDFERTCQRTTREECAEREAGENTNVEFYEGLLCSNEDLATSCGQSERTRVVEGKDEVYFVDTCGNLANIYDANRVDDQSYWNEIIGKAQSCELNYNSNGDPLNAESCGNCDYFAGSTGKRYDSSIDGTPGPEYGDYICRNLNCEYRDRNYKHGETWCTRPEGVTNPASAGGRSFRAVCYNGDVTIEPCADFRQETCIQSSIPTEQGPFSTAACRVNRWQDCISQKTIDACENDNLRDCTVIRGAGIGGSLKDSNGDSVDARCVPKNAPGFNFWESGTDAGSICAKGNVQCTVRIEETFEGSQAEGAAANLGLPETKGLVQSFFSLGKEGTRKEIIGECFTESGDKIEVSEDWLQQLNNACISLGDCGVNVNYVGENGDLDLNDLYNT